MDAPHMSAQAILVIGLLLLSLWWLKRPSGMPPGPPRTFLGDNRAHLSPKHPWKTFTEWNKTYGPLCSLYLGRTPVIVLGSAQTAWDLLDKRSEIYSGRPRSIMAGEILSWGVRAITMPYNARYKRWRSLMQASLNSTAAAQYRPLQSLESKLFLRKLLDLKDAMEYRDHLSVFQMSVIFRLAYGRRVRTLQDEIVLANQKAGASFGSLQVPGKYLVESWPILLWLPHRLQWFRHDVEKARQKNLDLYMGLMNRVREQMADGTAQPSMATFGLQRQQEFGLTDLEMAYTLAGPWDAGVGTTVITIEIFLLAMLHHPEVMQRAQAEIDSVIGFSRMPDYDDMDSLPYITALMKEVARWRPVARTGFPHQLIQDDTYNGYFLPKGATVYANINAIMQDPELFPDPEVFRPERFLETTHPKLQNFTIHFGFGRRICPGMYIANQSIFIVLVRLLWAFNIEPAVGADGKLIIPSDDEFVRNTAAKELIVLEAERAEAEAARWDTD